MATTHHCPVFIWQSHQGKFTARLADDFEEGIAVGDSRREVLDQLREYLLHRSRRDDFFWLDPDFSDATIRQVKVAIVPEYRDGERRFPSGEPIHFKLPCAVGRRASGLWAACFPTLDVYFDFAELSRFNQLARHYAREFLSDRPPRELSRFLPPVSCEVDTVSVSIRETPPRVQLEDPCPQLSAVASPVDKRSAGRIGRAWEREAEVQELTRLLREESGSLCLVGESGGGKTSVLVEAVRRLAREEDSPRSRPRFWLTSAARLVAGMRYLGEWQQRCEETIREMAGLRGVLCVESLADLVGNGGGGPESSVAAFLIPYLRNGELRMVTEATPEEMEACDRVLPGLIDEMRILKIDELSERQALTVLELAGEYHSQNDGVVFSHGAAAEVYHLFRRFQPYVAFPGRALQLMGAIVDRKLREQSAGNTSLNEVRREFASVTGLPEPFLRDDEPLDLEGLTARFEARLLGQKEAVERVCRTIAKFKAGLNDPGRPIAVLLFVGPTGVGKTQLVKCLGDFLFPGKPEKERLVRLDMSEYAGPDAAQRLIGHAQGRPGELVRRVRANPFSVILFDEVEKASPEVFDLLMNVFEEGRLRDALGRVTSFNSSILVMTSNLGSTSSGPLGFAGGGADPAVPPVQTDARAIRAFFRPEFFNRIDHIVEFKPLGRATIEQITRLELEGLAGREGFTDRRISLEFGENLVRRMASIGFDPVYGARPLQRAIEEGVVMPLARKLVTGDDPKGKCLFLDWDEQENRLRVEERELAGAA
jgi:ATP-dependent Clp protease ATP-binding subunit ClpC